MIFISASQVALWRECARKWAFRYLAGIKTPQHPAAALGTEVDDKQLQPYLRDGRPFDFSRDSGYIAAAGLAYLPKPQTPGLVVQKHFTMASPTWRDGAHIGFGFQGYMDLWLPDSGAVPDMPGGEPFVGDFKTTSDLKWAKNEKALSVDVQANLYATDAMYETGARNVDLSWMYFQTRGPRKTKRTYLRVSGDQVAEQFGRINDTAIEMLGVRVANPNPLELPPSPDQCEAYGGCPHRTTCNLSPVQIIAALDAKSNRLATALGLDGSEIMSNTNAPNQTSNLLQALRLKKAGQAPPAGAAAAAVMTAPPSLEEHVAANPRAAFLLQPPAPEPMTRAGIPIANLPSHALPGVVGINPPESALPPAPAVNVTQAPATEPKRRGRPPKLTPAPENPSELLLATTPAAAPAGPPSVVNVGGAVDIEKLAQVARAVRAAADAFLIALTGVAS